MTQNEHGTIWSSSPAPQPGNAGTVDECAAPAAMPVYRGDIVLASASPRRREMFAREGIPVKIRPSGAGEHLPMALAPETTVMFLALCKAQDVAAREQGFIVAADTIVVADGRIIGKPADGEEAFAILSLLRNRTHQVITGVCLIDNTKEPAEKRCLFERTDVVFGIYSDDELRAYVRTGEPYDKAGGYAIQETFGRYIDRIAGDRDNVIGFPMNQVLPYLERDRRRDERG